MILIINTSQSDKLSLILHKKNHFFKKEIKIDFFESEKILVLINQILEENKVKLIDFKGIGVFRGPGPFTALRIGITIANTLAYALAIPVYGFKENEVNDLKKLSKKIEQNKSKAQIKPFYGQLPSITKPKKAWLK